MFVKTFISRLGKHIIDNPGVTTTAAIPNVMADIKTFVFFDCETTGLPQYENNTTRITELCLIAVEADHLRLGVFPRVHNKLSLCFNPQKSISAGAAQITGLGNELLEHQSSFSVDTVHTIKHFLNHNRKPICFVAHNGNYFDYPILQAELSKTANQLSDDILCIDSLKTFRDIHLDDNQTVEAEPNTSTKAPERLPVEFSDGYDALLCHAADLVEYEAIEKYSKIGDVQQSNEKTPQKQIIRYVGSSSKKLRKRLNFGTSFKLKDIFIRLTSKNPTQEHEAEGDVVMLITCAATLGDKFIDWANENAVKFNSISCMTPGTKIGS